MSNRTRPGPQSEEPHEALPLPTRPPGAVVSRTIAAAWSGAAAWTLVNWARVESTDPSRLLLLVAFIALFLTLPAHWLLSWSWNAVEGRRRVLWLTTCVAVGGMLALAIPVELRPQRTVEGTVEVVATGDKNPASAGSEIWIFEVSEDGRSVPLDRFDRDGAWEVREGVQLSASRGSRSLLTWEAKVSRQLVLTVLTHAWSGIVEVTWEGSTRRIDLYAESDHVRAIELSPSSSSPIYPLSVLLASSLFFGLIVLVASVWLIDRPTDQVSASKLRSERWGRPAHGGFGQWEWLALATPPAVVWSVYLLAFWPGVMSIDSIEQWGQLLTGDITNWHPAFHTLTEWLLTRLAESPAIVATAQIAALSGVVGWALASLRRLGLSSAAAWVISGAVALWPANGITVITLWKDVPYAIAVLGLGVIILLEIDERHGRLEKRGGWILVGGVATLVALYHHAGLLVAVGSLGALWLAVRRRAVIGAALLAVVVVAMVQGGLYRAVGVSGGHPGIDLLPIDHIGAHLVDGTPLTAQEQTEIAQLIPIPGASWYDCESVNAFLFHPSFSISSMHEQAGRARSLWWSLFTRDPTVDLGHIACRSHVAWRISQVPGGHRYATELHDADGVVSAIVANDHGLELSPILDSLTGVLADVVFETQNPATSWLWWRGPLYLYVLLFGAAIAALRARSWRYWAVATPAVLVAGSLVIAAPAQDFRYMYPVFLSGMILGPFLLFAVKREEGKATNTGRDLQVSETLEEAPR